jgi:hypothetical protein
MPVDERDCPDPFTELIARDNHLVVILIQGARDKYIAYHRVSDYARDTGKFRKAQEKQGSVMLFTQDIEGKGGKNCKETPGNVDGRRGPRRLATLGKESRGKFPAISSGNARKWAWLMSLSREFPPFPALSFPFLLFPSVSSQFPQFPPLS